MTQGDVITHTCIRNVFYFCNRVAVSKQARLSFSNNCEPRCRFVVSVQFLSTSFVKGGLEVLECIFMTFSASLYQGRSNTASGVEGEHESPSVDRTENVLVCITSERS